MIKQRKDQKNGTEKDIVPNVVAPITKPLPENKAKITLEERIQRVEELRSLTMKRQYTIGTVHNLRSFHFASDDSCNLVLTDSQGHKFQTGNTNLIALLKDYLEKVLNDKVSALDDEILAFQV